MCTMTKIREDMTNFRGVCIGDLERNLCAHSVSVSDNWLLVCALPVPTIQLDTATSGEQRLAVHLHRRPTRKLMT